MLTSEHIETGKLRVKYGACRKLGLENVIADN